MQEDAVVCVVDVIHTILFLAIENKKNKYLYSEDIALHGEKTLQCKSSVKYFLVSVV